MKQGLLPFFTIVKVGRRKTEQTDLYELCAYKRIKKRMKTFTTCMMFVLIGGSVPLIAGATLVYIHELSTAVRRSVDTPLTSDPRRRLGRQLE